MNPKRLLSLSLAAGLTIISAAAQANLVQNGGFEVYSGGTVSTTVSTAAAHGAPSELGNTPVNGYTTLSGWTVGANGAASTVLGFLMDANSLSNGSRDIRYNDTFCLWGPTTTASCTQSMVNDPSRYSGVPILDSRLSLSPSGGNFVALDSEVSHRGSGISQVIDGLTVGAQYRVAFEWASAQQHGFELYGYPELTNSVQVTFGNASMTTHVEHQPNRAFRGWFSEAFAFTATATQQTLNFLAVGTPNGLPPFVLLDGVSVERVPEPSAALLALGALGALGVARRRRATRGSRV